MALMFLKAQRVVLQNKFMTNMDLIVLISFVCPSHQFDDANFIKFGFGHHFENLLQTICNYLHIHLKDISNLQKKIEILETKGIKILQIIKQSRFEC
jgi:hypothetical protein